MDKYRMDSHKLIYHPERVLKWLNKGDCYPIYIEISPTNRCNHRCIFCALDYLEYKPIDIDYQMLDEVLSEISSLGVKAVMFAGEGEPLLHRNIEGIVESAKTSKLDVSMTTNGVFLSNHYESILKNLSWIRISLDAGSSETHSNIHKCPSTDFSKIVGSIIQSVAFKRLHNLNCTVGVQFLLLMENRIDVLESLTLCKSLGVDYFSIKPYSHHPESKNELSVVTRLTDLGEDIIRNSNSEDFSVIYREGGFARRGVEKSYTRCLGLPFFSYIDSKGDIYTCSTFLGNPDFVYGNIYKDSFRTIWNSSKRKEVLERVASLNISSCRENCRLDNINQYLWDLKYPIPHINFI